jgi:hypothetical protein
MMKRLFLLVAMSAVRFRQQNMIVPESHTLLILLANSKSSNFNGFQSGHPGGTTK